MTMWKIIGTLLFGLIVHSNALKLNSSLLESRISKESSATRLDSYDLISGDHLAFVVSIGFVLAGDPDVIFHPYFIGNMISKKHALTFITASLLKRLIGHDWAVSATRETFDVGSLFAISEFQSLYKFAHCNDEFVLSSPGFTVVVLSRPVATLRKRFTYPEPGSLPSGSALNVVGYNNIDAARPPPTHPFVRMSANIAPHAQCAISDEWQENCLEIPVEGHIIQEDDMGALVLRGQEPVGLIIKEHNGRGAFKFVPCDEFRMAINRIRLRPQDSIEDERN